MDASFLLEYCGGERAEAALHSQACGSQNEIRATKLGSLEKKEGCSHFSIRGYVSEVRKRDQKICWPFLKFHGDYNLDMHEDLLPPMPVAEFKWWECKSCLHKVNEAEMIAGKRDTKSSACRDIIRENFYNGNPMTTSFAAGPCLVSAHQQVCGEALPKRWPVDENVTINEGCKTYQTLCGFGGQLEVTKSEKPVKVTKSENIKVPQTSISGEHYDQIQSKKLSADDVIASEQCRKGAHITKTTTTVRVSNANGYFPRLPVSGSADVLVIVQPRKGISEKWNCLLKGTKMLVNRDDIEKNTYRPTPLNIVHPICKRGNEWHKTNKKKKKRARESEFQPSASLGKNHLLLNDNAETSDSDNISLARLMGLNGGPSEVFLDNNIFSENREDNYFRNQLEYSSKNSHSKKAQKTRRLNDIMNSEGPGTKKQPPASCRGVVKQEAAKEEKMGCMDKELVNVQREKRKTIKNNKRRDICIFEDEEAPLAHCLNRMPEKVKLLKQENRQDLKSSGVACVKRQDSNVRIGGCTEKNNGFVTQCSKQSNKNSKQVLAPKNPKLFKQSAYGNGCFELKSGLKKLNSDKCNNKSSSDIFGRQTHARLSLLDKERKKSRKDKKKISSLQVEDKEQSFCHSLKDPRSANNANTDRDLRRCQNVPEKSNEGKLKNCDPTVVDGVPVEILKLLQENWLKRHIVNATCSSQGTVELSNVPKTAEDIKDGKPVGSGNNISDKKSCGVLDWKVNESHSKPHGKRHEISSASLRDQAEQSFLFEKSETSVKKAARSKDDSFLELNLGPSYFDDKCKSYINSTKDGQVHSYPCFAESSNRQEHQRIASEHPIIMNSSGRVCPQSHKMMLQNVASRKDKDVSGQNSLRSYLGIWPLAHSSSPTYEEINHPEHFMDFSHITRPSQDALHRQKLVNLPPEIGYSKATNSVVSYTQKRKISDLKNNKETMYANEMPCVRNVRPIQDLNVYAKDSFSAMHLLRLMDPAVGSSSASSSAVAGGRKEVIKHSDLCHTYKQQKVIPWAECSARISESSTNSMVFGSHSQSHHARSNPGLSYAVPNNIMHGPLFVNQTTSYCNTLAPSLVFKDGIHNQEYYFKGHGTENEGRANRQHIFRNRGPEENILSVSSYTSQPKVPQGYENIAEKGNKINNEAVESPNKRCKVELCVLNRNPADFTIPDDDNEYMIGHEDLRRKNTSRLPPIYPNHRRQQKAMKLTALKGLLRS